MTIIDSPDALNRLKEKAKAEIDLRSGLKDIRVTVHMGTCGIASGARGVLAAIIEDLSAAEINNVSIQQTGCIGMCEFEPMISITDKTGEIYRYGRLNADKAHEIVKKHLLGGQAVEEYLIKD